MNTGGPTQPVAGGQSVPTGGFPPQASGHLPDPWAGASWGQGWADSCYGRGRKQEYNVDLRMWSD
eukprot:2865325-Alexandrium_andersonii.AAC.1